MRRLSAAGAAILVCLALGGIPALAQDNTGVTATQACEWLHVGGAAECTYTASDPRLTGSLTLEEPPWTHVLVPPLDTAALVWFDAVLQGPEGTWTGSVGVVNESQSAHPLMVLTGDGAYEGWTYVAAGSASQPGDHHGYVFQDRIDTVGVLYQGAPPAFGPPAPMPPPSE
jgi:hypothetical protein